jgi:hypothetical protein
MNFGTPWFKFFQVSMIFFYLILVILIARESKLVFASETKLELENQLLQLHNQFKDAKNLHAQYKGQPPSRDRDDLRVKWRRSLDIFHKLFAEFDIFSKNVFFSSFYIKDVSQTITAVDLLVDYSHDLEFITFFWGLYYCREVCYGISMDKWKVEKFFELGSNYKRYRLAVSGIEQFIKSNLGIMQIRKVESQNIICRFIDYYLEYLDFIPLPNVQNNGPYSAGTWIKNLKENPFDFEAYLQEIIII